MRMGMYVKSTGSGAKCSFCEERLAEGDVYIRLTFHRVWPYVHQKCLKATYNALEAKKPNFKVTFDAAMAKKNAATLERKELNKKKKLKKNWNCSIMKEALKTQSILVSKISITNTSDGNVWRIAEKNSYKPYCFIVQDDGKIFVIKPWVDGRHTDSIWRIKRMSQQGTLPEHTEVQIADPEAFRKIGEAITRHSIGDWSPYRKKKKCK